MLVEAVFVGALVAALAFQFFEDRRAKREWSSVRLHRERCDALSPARFDAATGPSDVRTPFDGKRASRVGEFLFPTGWCDEHFGPTVLCCDERVAVRS